MTTLTDRYIAAATRSLKPKAQQDVRNELLGAIADDIEARVAGGISYADAELAAITELGDPDALAARYADRPLHLIGPKFYLTWWRLLKLLLWIVPPVAVVGTILGMSIAGEPIGGIIATAWAVLIGTIVHLAFWTTLVFAILDRMGADTGLSWSVDSLPEVPESGASRGELISTLVLLGITSAWIVWDRFVGVVYFGAGGNDTGSEPGTQVVSVLNPELWPWWVGGLFVLFGFEAALAIAVYVRRGWRASFALVNTVLATAVAAGVVYLLATGSLFNPALVELTLGREDVPSDVTRIVAILIGFVIVGVAIWDVIDGWRKARRRSA